MNWASFVRTTIVVLILIVLHYTLRPLLAWRTEIDFLLIALVFSAVRMRPAAGAVFGFLLGIAADSLELGAFGSGALAATVVGFSASYMKAVFFADNLALNGFFLFLGKWVFDLVYVLMERRMGGTELLMQLIVWSPLSAAVTAVAGVIAITVLRPILEVRSA
ncbi:MAG TPA: rod shape-determining protein MreD [Gemmatimonadaceae bacterium]|nr:rod shape-determining protein MreD [Gemmatimonadaceae bacterium]